MPCACGKPVAVNRPDGSGLCMGCFREAKKDEDRVKALLRRKRPTVFVDVREGQAVAKPVSYLGGDLFDHFRDATSGSGLTYQKKDSTNRGPTRAVVPLVLALRAADIDVVLSSTAHREVEALKSRIEAVLERGKEQLRRRTEHLRAVHGIVPFPYQVYGALWVMVRAELSQGPVLGDEMGLGKTIQWLLAVPDGAPIVVACRRVAKGVWRREIRRVFPNHEILMAKGRDGFRWPGPGQATIVHPEILPQVDTYDTYMNHRGQLGTYDDSGRSGGLCSRGTWLMGDEAQDFKNEKAVRTKRFRAMAHWVRDEGGVAAEATGTLLHNQPQDLWGVLDNVGVAHEAFGNWFRFSKAFGGHKGDFGWEYDPDLVDPNVGWMLQRVMLRRKRAEVLPELPGKIIVDVPVEIPEEEEARRAAAQGDLYTTERDPFAAADAAMQEIANSLGVPREQVGLQSADAILDAVHGDDAHFTTARWALTSTKFEALEELVTSFEDAGEPVVVFSTFRAPVDWLELREGWAAIKGGQTDTVRQKVESDFQEGDLKGLACMIQVAGVALTLTRAAHAIFVDESWVPSDNQQAQDRLVRIGQTRGVTIHRLIADHPLDRVLSEALRSKMEMEAATVDRAKVPVVDVAAKILRDFENVVGDVETVDADPIWAHFRAAAPRGPTTTIEGWAILGLKALAGNATYHHSTEDDVLHSDFQPNDREFGCSLAKQYVSKGLLSPKQWPWVVKIADRYRRRVEELIRMERPTKLEQISEDDERFTSAASIDAQAPGDDDVPF